MKKITLFTLLFTTNLILSQNTVPATGTVSFDTSLKLGNQVSSSGEGQIVRLSLTPFRHTGGPWNFKSRDNSTVAFLDIDYGNFGTALTITSDKNIGIGTINPNSKLNVIGSASFEVPDNQSGNSGSGFSIQSFGGTNLKLGGNYTYSWIQSHAAKPLYINELGNNTIFNLSSGNVGIGTASPVAKLHINNGDNSYGVILANASEYPFSLYAKTITTQPVRTESFRIGMKYYDDLNNGFISFYRGDGGVGGFLGFSTYGVERIRISNNGNVGIGEANPNNKLDVNGTIHSKEVKVDMNGWSDFVFRKDYSLPTLQEVEKHIAEKGHLENIPSEEEVLKNGINLGEMNSKLLQKIEELTLYAIEQQKNTEKLNKIIEQLSKRLEIIESK